MIDKLIVKMDHKILIIFILVALLLISPLMLCCCGARKEKEKKEEKFTEKEIDIEMQNSTHTSTKKEPESQGDNKTDTKKGRKTENEFKEMEGQNSTKEKRKTTKIEKKEEKELEKKREEEKKILASSNNKKLTFSQNLGFNKTDLEISFFDSEDDENENSLPKTPKTKREMLDDNLDLKNFAFNYEKQKDLVNSIGEEDENYFPPPPQSVMEKKKKSHPNLKDYINTYDNENDNNNSGNENNNVPNLNLKGILNPMDGLTSPIEENTNIKLKSRSSYVLPPPVNDLIKNSPHSAKNSPINSPRSKNSPLNSPQSNSPKNSTQSEKNSPLQEKNAKLNQSQKGVQIRKIEHDDSPRKSLVKSVLLSNQTNNLIGASDNNTTITKDVIQKMSVSPRVSEFLYAIKKKKKSSGEDTKSTSPTIGITKKKKNFPSTYDSQEDHHLGKKKKK